MSARSRTNTWTLLAVGLLVGSGCGGAPGSGAPEPSVAMLSREDGPVGSVPDPTVDDEPATTTPATTAAPLTTTTTPTTRPTTASTTTAPETVERSGAEAGPVAEVGDPLAIRIPSIGVDSALVPTGVLEDGTVAVPPDANVAGWFDQGPRPGERGPSLIMGHVDSARTGPGVFYDLRDIEVGAIVTVDNPDGSLDFVVERVEQHSKLDFPTEEVYGPSPASALRLVTCGGSFDRAARSYYDNIIVYLGPVTP